MATLQSVCLLTKVNTQTYFLAILLAFFLNIVTAGQAFPDGGHGGAPIAAGPFSVCGSEKDALDAVKKHGEKRAGYGIAANHLTVLYVNPETGSWTFVVFWSRDRACFLRAGHSWQIVPQGDPS